MSPSYRERHSFETTETTSLLGSIRQCESYGHDGYGHDKGPENYDHPKGPEKKKKHGNSSPRIQILLLCYARLMEPVAFFSIFPYVAEMVQRNGDLPDSDVGFYSGLVESLFSATQAVVIMFWGTLADRVGRKPMLVYSLVGMTVGTAMFGMASSIWQMILIRSLTGLFSGANLIVRTMIGEHCTPETQATFFSWYAVAGNLGIFLGPIIGGALVDPATQYPSAFQGITFLEQHPYALPGIAVAAANITAAISSMLFLKETLRERPGYPYTTGDLHESQQDDRAPELSVRELLGKPNIPAVFCVYGYVMLLAIAFTAIHPVVLFTPADVGGFGLSTGGITLYITAVGASETLWLMFAFPILQRRVGTKSVLRICAWGWPCFFAGYMIVSALLRGDDEDSRILAIVFGTANVVLGPGTFMSLTAVQLAVNEASPGPDVLGKLNSIAEICFSVIRSVIPGLATALYAAGVRGHILSGYFAWVFLIILSMGLPFALRWFPEDFSPLIEDFGRIGSPCSEVGRV